MNTSPFTCDQMIQWLIDRKLPPLPVAPAFPASEYPAKDKAGKNKTDKEGNPIAAFTGKNPSYLDRSGKPQLLNHRTYQKRVPSPNEAKDWFHDDRTGIGTLGGISDIYWIDFDLKQFRSQEDCDRAFRDTVAKIASTDLWQAQTQSGGYRIAVRLTVAPDFTNFALSAGGDHVGEVLGSGRFTVLPPTVGAAGRYTLISDGEPIAVESLESIGIFPTSARNAATVTVSVPRRTIATPGAIPLDFLGNDRSREILSGSDLKGDRSEALTTAIREWFGWARWAAINGISVRDSAEQLAEIAGAALGLDGDRVGRILKTVNPDECQPACLLVGDERSAWLKIKKLNKAAYREKCPDRIKSMVEGVTTTASGQTQQPDTPEKGTEDQGELVPIAANFQRLKALLGNRLRLNTLSKEIELDGETVTIDSLELRLALEHNKQFKYLQTISTGLAKEAQYNPVKEYLEACHAKHGNDATILENFATNYLNRPEPIYNTFLRKWAIGCVARIMQPGCKLDTALILKGSQGIGKSSLFKVLASQEWFDDSLGAIGDKDERLKLHRAWIIEWGELETIFKRKDVSATKAFLSCSVDNVRPPYGRSVEIWKRQSVIVGTTNQDEFLNDPTGNRRFWVVPISGNLDLERLRAERDRFWAAAVELYERGESWWLSSTEEFQSEQIAQEFQNRDPWYEAVERHVSVIPDGRATTSEILTNGIKLELSRQTRGEQMRVADILRSLGWEQKTQVYLGKRQRIWAAPAIAQHPESQPTQPISEVVTEVVSIGSFGITDFEGDRHNLHNLNQIKTDFNLDVAPQAVGEPLESPTAENLLKSFDPKGCDGCDDRLKSSDSGVVVGTTYRHNLKEGRVGCDAAPTPFQVGDRVEYDFKFWTVSSIGKDGRLCLDHATQHRSEWVEPLKVSVVPLPIEQS